MLNKIREAVDSYLKEIKTLAIAVSGGADSVALLSAMQKLAAEYGIEIFAAHFNHKLRGEEADRDEVFVKSLCKKQGIRLVVGSGDVADFAKQNKLSTELAARQLRYEFLSTLKADAVATAHTASDNLETVVFNLTRGSGINGLCGIPVKRDKYIRPLIFCTRQDVEKYCKEQKLEYVTDSTNLSDDYTRNLIRHKIVPVLKGINPNVEEAVTNTALLLESDRDFLDDMAEKKYNELITKSGLDAKKLIELSPPVASRVLRIFYTEKLGTIPDYRHTDDMFNVAVSGGRCSLPFAAQAVRQKSVLRIINSSDMPDFNVKIDKQKNPLIKKDKKVNNLLLKNLIDCDKIVGELKIRTREEGDRIRLLGRGCTKTLKQLYNENAVPLENRKKLPVIADDFGVVWIAGIGVAERVAVDINTDFVYKITY